MVLLIVLRDCHCWLCTGLEGPGVMVTGTAAAARVRATTVAAGEEVVQFSVCSLRQLCWSVHFALAYNSKKEIIIHKSQKFFFCYFSFQLSTENQELREESVHCLSLLVQLYGGEGHNCLSSSCLQSFSHILQAYMHTETPLVQRTILRIIKRLVSKVHM